MSCLEWIQVAWARWTTSSAERTDRWDCWALVSDIGKVGPFVLSLCSRCDGSPMALLGPPCAKPTRGLSCAARLPANVVQFCGVASMHSTKALGIMEKMEASRRDFRGPLPTSLVFLPITPHYPLHTVQPRPIGQLAVPYTWHSIFHLDGFSLTVSILGILFFLTFVFRNLSLFFNTQINQISKHLLITHCVPGTVLSTGVTKRGKRHSLPLRSLQSSSYMVQASPSAGAFPLSPQVLVPGSPYIHVPVPGQCCHFQGCLAILT